MDILFCAQNLLFIFGQNGELNGNYGWEVNVFGALCSQEVDKVSGVLIR